MVKRELKSAKHLCTFNLSLDEYEKAKTSEKELLIKCKMYDVANVHITGNMVKVVCLADEFEDSLIANLDAIEKQKTKNTNDHNLPVIKFLSLIYISSASQQLTALGVSNYKHFYSYQLSIKPSFILIESPPPQA